MKQRHILTAAAIAATVAGALLAGGCKTTEANYRAAYERAVATRDADKDPIDNTIYAAIRNEALPSVAVAGTDTLNFKYERLTVTEGQETPGALRRYNVVAGQFKQAFNARAMAQRMRDNGYTETFLAQTAEPLYYVVTFATDDAMEARRALQMLSEDTNVRLLPPAPFVVSPSMVK